MDLGDLLRNFVKDGEIIKILIILSKLNRRDFLYHSYDVLSCAMEQNKKEIVSAMLERDETQLFPSNSTCPNDCRNSVLHVACKSGSADVIPLILNDRRCNKELVNMKNIRGVTAALVAFNAGHINCIKELNKSPLIDYSKQLGDFMTNCFEGDVENTKAHLESGININLKSPKRREETALHCAMQGNQTGIVKLLLEHEETRLDIQDKDGNNPLHKACICGSLDVIPLFINDPRCTEQIVNQTNHDDLTPAKIAVSRGSLECLIKLEKYSKIINWRQLSKHWELVKMINNDAPKEIRLREPPEKLERFFKEKKKKSDEDLVHFLESLDKSSDNMGDLLYFLRTSVANRNSQRKDGMTALHFSMHYNHVELVKELLDDQGVKLDIRNDEGQTSLNLACRTNAHQAIDLYCKDERCTDKNLNEMSSDSKTPLSVAIEKNNLETVKVFARVEGIDWSIITENINAFRPCIPKVDRHNWKKSMKQFLESELCLKRQKESRRKIIRLHESFFMACRSGREDILENLKEEPLFDIHCTDSESLTGLDQAVIHNQAGIVMWLLNNINITLWYSSKNNNDFVYSSPLYHAVENNSYAAYEILESFFRDHYKSMVNIKNNLGVSAIMLAVQTGKLEFLKRFDELPDDEEGDRIEWSANALLALAKEHRQIEVLEFLKKRVEREKARKLASSGDIDEVFSFIEGKSAEATGKKSKKKKGKRKKATAVVYLPEESVTDAPAEATSDLQINYEWYETAKITTSTKIVEMEKDNKISPLEKETSDSDKKQSLAKHLPIQAKEIQETIEKISKMEEDMRLTEVENEIFATTKAKEKEKLLIQMIQ